MEPRIDVHVLHMPAEHHGWASDCDALLRQEPVNIHHLDGIYGRVRDARYRGFNEGNAEYVSFVDPDDYIEPGIFQQCLDALDANPGICGVYTMSNIVHGDGTISLRHPFCEYGEFTSPRPLEIHQLTVMRRDCVDAVYATQYDSIPVATGDMQWVYWSMAADRPWVALPVIGYNWRDHQYNNNKLMRMNSGHDLHRIKKHILSTWSTICRTA